MTLAALLEELKEVDVEQSEKLQCWIGRSKQVIGLEIPLDCDLAQALIQASIQSAIKRRMDLRVDKTHQTWGMVLGISLDGAEAWVWGSDGVEHSGFGGSPAEALLAAYIAAVREEAKR